MKSMCCCWNKITILKSFLVRFSKKQMEIPPPQEIVWDNLHIFYPGVVDLCRSQATQQRAISSTPSLCSYALPGSVAVKVQLLLQITCFFSFSSAKSPKTAVVRHLTLPHAATSAEDVLLGTFLSAAHQRPWACGFLKVKHPACRCTTCPAKAWLCYFFLDDAGSTESVNWHWWSSQLVKKHRWRSVRCIMEQQGGARRWCYIVMCADSMQLVALLWNLLILFDINLFLANENPL